MIDFRYHLVSIVSIFLALAVGIVLGAGPLKEDIGNTLTRELNQLRQDKTDLRTELGAARSGSDARDSYAAAVAPVVTRDALTGKTVAIVVLPGADAGVVKATAASLSGAGAKVGSTVTLSDSWADPSQRVFRNKLAENLAALVKASTGASNADQLPAAILALSILSGTDQAIERTAPGASQVLDGLKEGKLLTYVPEQISPSSGVVLVGGQVVGKDDEDTQARLEAYLQLASALDARSTGSVLISASTEGDPRAASNLLAAARSDSAVSKAVSTVDDADVPMGQSTTVLALAQQYTGASGHYGLAGDAKAVAPQIAAKQ